MLKLKIVSTFATVTLLLSMCYISRNNLTSFKMPFRTPSPEEVWMDTQALRRSLLQEGCKSLANSSSIPFPTLAELSTTKKFTLRNLLVDDIHRSLYCYIPKIACTQWKKIWMNLVGLTNETNLDNISTSKAHYSSGVRALSSPSFAESEILERLKEYKKFLIVRQPMERLYSAYKNKFIDNSSDARLFKKVYAHNMMKFVRNTSHVPISGEGMKFEEFLQYLAVHNPMSFQEHWQPYLFLCHPCVIDYDFIGKYETLEKDSNYILDRIQHQSNVRFPTYKATSTLDELHKIEKDIPINLYDRIYNIYQPDFTLFGYVNNVTSVSTDEIQI